MKKILIITFLVSSISLKAQEIIKPLKVNIEFLVDKYGNAKTTYAMKMTASQWDNFKRSMGNNQSLLKRTMERAMPAYFLSDFEYKEDAMDRSYQLSFNAYGVCKPGADGRWHAELGEKNPDITKLSDNSYMIISEMSSGGGLIQANQKVIFPDEASDIKMDKDAFGKALFSFNMSGASGSGKMMMYGGIGLIVLGLFFGWKNSRSA
ncbi:MAG: hypothetical protein JNL47_06930 [Bacteroidia bacterium]|nr:hypothetical protein [Bacteroidia bacterium]